MAAIVQNFNDKASNECDDNDILKEAKKIGKKKVPAINRIFNANKFDESEKNFKSLHKDNFSENDGNMEEPKQYEKKKVPYSKKGKSSNAKGYKKSNSNNDSIKLENELLELLEKKRNIERMKARKEHNDPNWDSQGTKTCAHFNKRDGCAYGRQCNMKHLPSISDINASIFQQFMTVINAPTKEQVIFLEKNKTRHHNYNSGRDLHFQNRSKYGGNEKYN
jgi:hypothetical protein